MPPYPDTAVVTLPVLDNATTDVVVEQLRKQGYEHIVIENVTRITATRLPTTDK